MKNEQKLDSLSTIFPSRLELLVSLGPSVIFSFLPHGDFQTTYVSENVIEQFGHHPSEFIDNPSYWD